MEGGHFYPCKILSLNFLRGTEQSNKNFSCDRRISVLDLNQVSSECGAIVLTTEPRRSVTSRLCCVFYTALVRRR
jgi:hypothetical protein